MNWDVLIQPSSLIRYRFSRLARLHANHLLWWLHGITAEQIASLSLQLPCALAAICPCESGLGTRPCPPWQKLTDMHVSLVCFLLQGKRQETASWLSTKRQA